MIGYKNSIILVNDLTKEYLSGSNKPTLIESLLKKSRFKKTVALKKVSFEVRKGEKLGLIGLNGAGKTTLLKLVAGITTPTKGRVETRGRIASLIDLEAGFHPDLSGSENVFVNGVILGMTKSEINQKFNSIVRFSGLGKKINEPLFKYSQGMKLRLGFSVATHVDPDIFLLDESVGVGDKFFQEKVSQTIERLFRSDKTIIVASHWLDFLKENCNRIVWLEDGRVKRDGKIQLIREYEKSK